MNNKKIDSSATDYDRGYARPESVKQMNNNYRVKNPTVKNPQSPYMTVGSFLVENVESESLAVIEAEKVWKRAGYSFDPQRSLAVLTTETLPELCKFDWSQSGRLF